MLIHRLNNAENYHPNLFTVIQHISDYHCEFNKDMIWNRRKLIDQVRTYLNILKEGWTKVSHQRQSVLPLVPVICSFCVTYCTLFRKEDKLKQNNIRLVAHQIPLRRGRVFLRCRKMCVWWIAQYNRSDCAWMYSFSIYIVVCMTD